MSVVLNTKHLSGFINEEEYKAIYPQVEAAHNQLEAKNGPGNDFLGWMYLPRDYDKEEFARIKEAAKKIREDSEVLVVAGIGGSYLGARAVIEAVKGLYHNELEDGPKIYFCGNSISPSYLNDIIALCKGKKFSINVISKSGTTTETSLAFRVLRKLLEDEMGVEEANKRIYATTDRAKGTLKQLADAQGWPTFVVPDDVGGRYSVLSAVGLLPIAAAGISIDELMKGAADAMERFSVLSPDNDAYKYAAIRNILYRKGKSVEILECYEPDFTLMNEWYKQLFGESEGKDNKGLFPASCIFSTDLHSMGQFIQEGSRIMFETIVDVKKPAQDLFIEELKGNFDGLNFLADQNMSVVNRKAMEGTILAHTDGGVPEVVIEVDDLSAYNVGYMIYFFWRACACSGYLLSVNPFNQPGVESYKKNMFALLGKPGYEKEREELLKLRREPDITKDGRKIEIYANIGNMDDLNSVLYYGAAGIGLLRSEFQYLGRENYPRENELFLAYKKIAETMGEKLTVIRTADLGADKQAEYLNIPDETNPIMGNRGIRLCLDRKRMFKAQLRAIFRASAYGNLALMYPMISSEEEMDEIEEIIREVKIGLDEKGIPYKHIKTGIMIETPAAVMISRELARRVDFLSLGTNDLSQYTLAMDRQNPLLRKKYNDHHPAVLRMIQMVIEAGHAENRRVCICGELAADTALTEEFLRMGVDCLSVVPACILPVRKALRQVDLSGDDKGA